MFARETLCAGIGIADLWQLLHLGNERLSPFESLLLSCPESIFELIEALERNQRQRGIDARVDQSAVNHSAALIFYPAKGIAMNFGAAHLEEGELYIVKQGQLRHLQRESDLPKVPVSEAAKQALLELRRGCRHALGGFRPDVALVASALIEHTASLPQAEGIVRAYFYAGVDAGRQPSFTPAASELAPGASSADGK